MSYARIAKERHLVTLWLSQVFSAIGDEFYSIASVWIAVQSGGPKAGFVAACGTIAGMSVGLLGGVFSDRWNRRTTMIVVDVLRATIVLILAVTAHVMVLQLWQLALAAACISSLSTFFEPSIQASLPELTRSSGTLQSMNSLMIVNHRLARTVGPGIAGLLVAVMPIHGFFLLDAVTFIVSAVAVSSISRSFQWKSPNVAAGKAGIKGVLADIADGARQVLEHEELTWSFGIFFLSCVVWGAAYVVGFPLWIKQVLGGNVGNYGTLVATYGIGSIVSNIIVGMIKTRRRMLFVSISQTMYGIGFFTIALAQNLPIACLGAAFAAAGGPVGDIMLLNMMQADMPRESLGRVYSLRNFVFSFGGSISLLIAPFMFSRFDARTGIAICAGGLCLSGLVGILKFGTAKSVKTVQT